jgi:hypothetical protein
VRKGVGIAEMLILILCLCKLMMLVMSRMRVALNPVAQMNRVLNTLALQGMGCRSEWMLMDVEGTGEDDVMVLRLTLRPPKIGRCYSQHCLCRSVVLCCFGM